MAKTFNGRIALDIRDSEPDWEPYLAPKAPRGAPNILLIAWRSSRRGTTRKTCLAARPSNGEAVRCCRNGQRLASCRLALR